MIESPTVNKWQSEALALPLLQVLARFGPLPSEVKEEIEATTEPRIVQDWIVRAAEAKSLDEFRQAAGV